MSSSQGSTPSDSGADAAPCVTSLAALLSARPDAGMGDAGQAGDAGDAGQAGDAGDAGQAGDAGDAGQVGDAAADDAEAAAPGEAAAPVGPSLLFDFDQGNVFSSLGHWDYAGVGGALGYSSEGHVCPGSLVASTNFDGKQFPQLHRFLFDSAQNWTGYTKLHIWLKVEAATSSTLGSVQAYVQDYAISGDFNTDNSSVSESTLADGNWHEMVFDLVPNLDAGSSSYDPTAVNQVGIQANASGSAYDGGPLPLVKVFVDDIWLE
jgi:hypothetical protein